MKNQTKYKVLIKFVFLLIFIEGCNSSLPSDKPSDVPVPSNTPTFIPTDTPIPTPTNVPVSLEGLEGALLTLSDMPTGWTVSLPEEEIEEEDKGANYTFLCMELERRMEGIVQAEFQKSEIAPKLVHSIGLYPKGLATEAFNDLVSASKACTEWTTPIESGGEQVWIVTPISFPKLGEETLAIRATSEISIFGFLEVDSIYILVGDVIIRISYLEIGLDGIDSTQTEIFARLSLEKLLSVYPYPIE
jgi:hypothetical protein